MNDRPLILVHTAHATALEHAGPGFGRLLSPKNYSRAADSGEWGIPWAADNGAFADFDPRTYRVMLQAIRGALACLFVTAPDAVGDWERTRRMWDVWRPDLDGFPRAYVLQDGQPMDDVPWRDLSAVFVGGTTEWKLGPDVVKLVRRAQWQGAWVHMGRVNSRRRFDYAAQLGVDSVDGSSFSQFRRRYLPDALRWHRSPLQQRLTLEDA